MDSGKDNGCVFHSGATEHKDFDQSFLQAPNKPHRSQVSNANGVSSPVTIVWIFVLTPSLSLGHTLFVPSLSINLLSTSQVTQQLNCLVLMYPYFCIFQELNNEIIGRGTKRGGLYYVDGVCRGISLTIKSSFSTKEIQNMDVASKIQSCFFWLH